MSVEIIQRERRHGCWHNWLSMCRELLDTTDDDIILTVQDDTIFSTAALTKLQEHWPADTSQLGFISLYTPAHYSVKYVVRSENGTLLSNEPDLRSAQRTVAKRSKHRPTIEEFHYPIGANEIDTSAMWGACALAFPRESLRKIIEHRFAVNWKGFTPKQQPHETKEEFRQRRSELRERPDLICGVDHVIGKVARLLRMKMVFLNPAVAQHVGRHSTLGHGGTGGRMSARLVMPDLDGPIRLEPIASGLPPIFCIMPPGPPRSAAASAARDNWREQGIAITDVDAVMAMPDSGKAAREQACSASNLKAVREFLSTDRPFGVILEDDAIVGDSSWLTQTDFDVFFPFWDNRQSSPHGNFNHGTIRDSIPRDGTFAMLLSRRAAEAWAKTLEQGGIADVSQRKLIAQHREWKIGSAAGNLVMHDGDAPSLIDDTRREKNQGSATKIASMSRRWSRSPAASPVAPSRPTRPDKSGYDKLRPDSEWINELPCRHRGAKVRSDACNLCGLKGTSFDVYQCELHGECSLQPRHTSVKACGKCADRNIVAPITTPPVAIPKRLNPKPTETPKPRPAAFTREPNRHLIYHIWPHMRSTNWAWNIQQLLRRIELFDGVRSIGVVTDPETASLADVQAEFGDTRIDHWFETPNQHLIGEPGQVMSDDGASALLGEGLSFLPLLQTLPRGENDVTFYGHAKGSRYSDGHIVLRWADMLYRTNLDHWSKVYEALISFPMCGSFKRYEDFDLKRNWHWHYSGTFFWFRNADVFASRDWPRLHPAMYGQVEAWPAGMFQSTETACLFGDAAHHLYLETEVAKWEAQIKDWPPDVRRIPNVISDREYYEAETSLRTDQWHHISGVHRHGAAVLKSLGCETALDVGSGLGAFLIAAKQAGIDATGFDVSTFQRDFAMTKGVEPHRYELSGVGEYRIQQPVDAIYCVEVFEHCTSEEIDQLASQFADNCRWLFFTSTPHFAKGDRAAGHINVKRREAWIELFARHGLTFIRDDESIVPWGLLFKGRRE